MKISDLSAYDYAGIMQADIVPNSADKDAAWEMYVELLTRTVAQPLPDDAGDERAALESVHAPFPVGREILRRHGRHTIQFSKVIMPVLNQVVTAIRRQVAPAEPPDAPARPAPRQRRFSRAAPPANIRSHVG